LPVFSADVISLNENPFMGRLMSLDFATAIAILLSPLDVDFAARRVRIRYRNAEIPDGDARLHGRDVRAGDCPV
jgi:hypothetical protein